LTAPASAPQPRLEWGTSATVGPGPGAAGRGAPGVTIPGGAVGVSVTCVGATPAGAGGAVGVRVTCVGAGAIGAAPGARGATPAAGIAGP
jgi:hypothetical protein